MVIGWVSIVYLGALCVLGVPLWKSAVIAVIVAVSLRISFGGRWLSRLGLALMIAAIAVWLGAVPPAEHWADSLTYVRTALSR